MAAAVLEFAPACMCTIEIAPKVHGSTPEQSKGEAVRSLEIWRGLMQGDA